LFNGKVIPFDVFQFLAHVFYYIPFTKYEYYNHVFWTLGIEFQFYIIVGLFYFLNKSDYYKFGFLCVFGASYFISFTNGYYLLNTYALYFAFGMAAFQYQYSLNKIFIFLMILFWGLIIYSSGWLIGLIMILSILVVFFASKKNFYLNFLGKISYSLYLTHPLVLIYSHGIIKKVWPSLLHFEIGRLIVYVVIAIVAASGFYFIIERPSISLSKKINFSD
jgi:peptidoglycan/LPS O-acetylase OafA/YrhL